MTLILILDVDIVKMYMHSKNEGVKVMYEQTDRQTDDRHDWKHYLPTYMGGKIMHDKHGKANMSCWYV